MPRPEDGTEPSRSRAVSVLRAAGFTIAVALAVVAVWLIVTSTSQKRIEIGVLAGLWGLLVGAYSVFGRHAHHPSAPGSAPAPGSALDLRPTSAVERAEDVAARREYEVRLEQMLRREIQAGLARELSGLRAEVAALRSELVEKVDGRLRLERIETTRVIGSDLEALQHEIRQLNQARRSGDVEALSLPSGAFSKAVEAAVRPPSPAPPIPVTPAPVPTAAIPAPGAAAAARTAAHTTGPATAPSSAPTPSPAPLSREPQPATRPEPDAAPTAPVRIVPAAAAPRSDALDAPAPANPAPANGRPSVAGPVRPAASAAPVPTPVPPRFPPPVPVPASPAAPARAVPSAPPVRSAPTPVAPAPAPVAQAPTRPATEDPFASLPRLRPFTDFELDPIDPPAKPPTASSAPVEPEPAAALAEVDVAGPRAASRRTNGDAPGSASSGGASSGGRRRRADDGSDDMLARILQREGSH